jgi:hypothetical protein
VLLNIHVHTPQQQPVPLDGMRNFHFLMTLIRDRKKLSIETKRQRPSVSSSGVRKGSSFSGFKQPYSADPRSPSGYLTPITPIERGLHSANAGYHRGSEVLGSPLPTSRGSVYSPDSTSPTVPLSRISLKLCVDVAINGHGRYQPQEIRPYGHGNNGYMQDNRQMLSKLNTQREEYVAVPLMDHTGTHSLVCADIDFTGKETTQHMMDPPASPHTFQQSMHHQDQIQRVVSPANQLAHYQAQYAGYETYHRTEDVQHDPRQQVPPSQIPQITNDGRCSRNGRM